MNKSAIPFVVIGGISLVAGGVVSAASAGSPTYLSAWATAYLVLVCGVAQLVLGLGQAGLASVRPSKSLIGTQAILLNLSNVAVLAGSLAALPFLTYLGAALLIVALALFVWGVRGAKSGNTLLLWGFRVMVLILLVSAPIGLVISHSRVS